MNVIILFSRCELVHLYGLLSKKLSSNFHVIHLAYSNKEEDILREVYGISELFNLENEVNKIDTKISITEELLKMVDNDIINNTQGRFNFNSTIQYDRTLLKVNNDECLRLGCIYHEFWDSFFLKHRPDYLLHEANAHILSQMASVVSVNYGVKYFTQIQTFGYSKFEWRFVDASDGRCFNLDYHYESNLVLSLNDKEHVKNFLTKFRNEFAHILPNIKSQKRKTLFFFTIKLILKEGQKLIGLNREKKERKYTVINHIEQRQEKKSKSAFYEIKQKWDYRSLEYDDFDDKKEFYYYPMHTEPEAVVLYWGDGIYRSQVKLIENIAAQFPAGTYLYVKDHPYGGKNRDVADYYKIKAIQNVKLLHPSVLGRLIIPKSKGVITINGTSGLEALLLNKQVFTFGNIYYNTSKRVKHLLNIRDLRNALYQIYDDIYEDDDEMYRFVNAYLKSSYKGFVAYFSDYPKRFNINEEMNAKLISLAFDSLLSQNFHE
jgi:hypothetical protein